MTIRYVEESDYGQDLLVLLAEIDLLMDKDRDYTKTEIDKTLHRVRNRCYNIITDLRRSGKDGDGYTNIRVVAE